MKTLMRAPLASATACNLVFMPPFIRPIWRPCHPFSLKAQPRAPLAGALHTLPGKGGVFNDVASIMIVLCLAIPAARPTMIQAKAPLSLLRFQRL